jgi:hypothetical protein
MIHVAYRPHVHMRFVTYKLHFRHERSSSVSDGSEYPIAVQKKSARRHNACR